MIESMAKQQLLSNVFTTINKEEMEDRVERDFAQIRCEDGVGAIYEGTSSKATSG